jgi:hypothetical protein
VQRNLHEVIDPATDQKWWADLEGATKWQGNGGPRRPPRSFFDPYVQREVLYRLSSGHWLLETIPSPYDPRLFDGLPEPMRLLTPVEALKWFENNWYDPPNDLQKLPDARVLNNVQEVPASVPSTQTPAGNGLDAVSPGTTSAAIDWKDSSGKDVALDSILVFCDLAGRLCLAATETIRNNGWTEATLPRATDDLTTLQAFAVRTAALGIPGTADLINEAIESVQAVLRFVPHAHREGEMDKISRGIAVFQESGVLRPLSGRMPVMTLRDRDEAELRPLELRATEVVGMPDAPAVRPCGELPDASGLKGLKRWAGIAR